MSVPIIDYSIAKNLGSEVDQYLSRTSFFQILNGAIDQELLSEVFRQSRSLFLGDDDIKERCRYLSAVENFGFQGCLEENLNPEAPADIKSTFTMRNILLDPPEAVRWPSDRFKQVMQAFYEKALSFAHQLQQEIATFFDLDPSFFTRVHTGETITLRLLHYPVVSNENLECGQLGAGAHTDYGFLTLLFQDNTQGLEVKDKSGNWARVPANNNLVTINSGDLLERWTNARYKPTEHRAVPMTQGVERFSIAMFIDPDLETLVSVLDACTSIDKPVKYEPILVRDHIQNKLEASHKGRFKS